MPRGYKGTLLERLERRSEHVGDCIIWRGATSNGYGHIFNGRSMKVSRAAAMLYFGLEMNDERQVNHRAECPNPELCWAREHLYLGTQKENIRDSIKAGTHNFVRK